MPPHESCQGALAPDSAPNGSAHRQTAPGARGRWRRRAPVVPCSSRPQPELPILQHLASKTRGKGVKSRVEGGEAGLRAQDSGSMLPVGAQHFLPASHCHSRAAGMET